MLNFFAEKRNDKAVLLKNYGGVYKIAGVKYIPQKTETFRFGGRTFKPKQAEYQNKFGRFIYFIDFDTGVGLHFHRSKEVPALNTKELDTLLSRSFIQGFVRVFGGAIKQDWVFMLIVGGFGAAIGFILGAFLV